MRKIIHVDMDAFYAAVEQRDNPALRGKPVVVGGEPGGRGVVSTCSYEARRYGIHSAMSSSRAYKLCPQAIFVPPRFAVYHEVSERIHLIFRHYTGLIEPLSLDEAYLDVTESRNGERSATVIAMDIRRRIREITGLTASAGVSCNKFVAKVASDFRKPDGLTVVPPEQVAAFVAALPIGKFYGVGKVTEKKMRELGIYTGADLLRFSEEELVQRFGKAGSYFYHTARGEDDRPVVPDRIRKSIGKENTFEWDLTARGQIMGALEELAAGVARLMAEEEAAARTVTVKVRYDDFSTVTRSLTPSRLIRSEQDLSSCLPALLERTEVLSRPVRLLGVAVSGLVWQVPGVETDRQLELPLDWKGSDFWSGELPEYE